MCVFTLPISCRSLSQKDTKKLGKVQESNLIDLRRLAGPAEKFLMLLFLICWCTTSASPIPQLDKEEIDGVEEEVWRRGK